MVFGTKNGKETAKIFFYATQSSYQNVPTNFEILALLIFKFVRELFKTRKE